MSQSCCCIQITHFPLSHLLLSNLCILGDESSALRIDVENKGYFDVRTKISGLSFGSGDKPLSSCDAVEAIDEEMGAIDNVAIQDLDGSIIGSPGYIVSDTDVMTAFAPSCTSHAPSCTAHCVQVFAFVPWG